MLRETVIAGAVAAALASGYARASDAPPPPYTLTGNIGFFSQYIFRGLTQTDHRPALQGGFDYARSNGLYAGTWASNISWLQDGAPPAYSSGGSLEWDFYGGMKGNIVGDVTYDVGTLYYYYPGSANRPANTLNIRADTWEVYGALGWKWLSGKYSYSIQNETFGVRDSQGTYYLDLTATLPLAELSKELDGLSLVAHWGYQKYDGTDPRNAVIGGRRLSNDEVYSYKDVKLGLSYALPKDFTVGAFWSKAYDTNVLGYGATNEIGAGGNTGVYPRNLAKSTATVFIQKTF
jgi:uncharacterized protein (TIGR02001 family)